MTSYGVKENGLNVGVDCHKFSPIDVETVLFYRNAICNHYDENVFLRMSRNDCNKRREE